MSTDELGARLMRTLRRMIDESEEVQDAALDLANAYGQEGTRVTLDIEAAISVEQYACDGGAVVLEEFSPTSRDRQFLKAMRITQE